MRLISYQSPTGQRAAAVVENGIVDLHQADSELPHEMKRFLALGQDGLNRAATAIASGQIIDRNQVKLLAPVPDPQKVICIGLNYADHAAESGAEIPSEPVVFNKLPSTVCSDGDAIKLPRESSQVDYEAELVLIIGQGGRRIPLEHARGHIAGYTCGHDVSARDWQLKKPGGQWLLGKTFDTFAPFGPEIVTADEIPHPGELDIVMRLNGQVMQSSNTRQLIFDVDRLISYISNVFTLNPGDVIFTGTPPGVGAARKPPIFLQPGDHAEVEIEQIGVLRNPIESD